MMKLSSLWSMRYEWAQPLLIQVPSNQSTWHSIQIGNSKHVYIWSIYHMHVTYLSSLSINFQRFFTCVCVCSCVSECMSPHIIFNRVNVILMCLFILKPAHEQLLLKTVVMYNWINGDNRVMNNQNWMFHCHSRASQRAQKIGSKHPI